MVFGAIGMLSAYCRWTSQASRGLAVRALAGLCCCLLMAGAQGDSDLQTSGYREPGAAVTRLLTATPPPLPLVHARSQRVALLFKQAVIPLERLARPYLGLAGFRFDPESGLSGMDPLVQSVEVIDTHNVGEPIRWRPGAGYSLEHVKFSPDGNYLSALKVGLRGPAELVVFELGSGTERRLDIPVNAAWGDPCVWVEQSDMLCRLSPREPMPVPSTKLAPIIIEHGGHAEPVRTYNNLLENVNEDALFEHYFTAELAHVSIGGTVRRLPATRGLFSSFRPSSDGSLALVTRLQKPYSRMVPARRFPNVLEVWDLGKAERIYRSSVAGFAVERNDDEHDRPHIPAWMPGTNTIGFIERVPVAPAGDDQRGPTFEYRWMAIASPFEAEPELIVSSTTRIERFGWTTGGSPYFFTRRPDGVGVTAYLVFPEGPREVWRGEVAERYMEAGRALRLDGQSGPVLELDGRIYISADGLDGDQPRPYLDSYDLNSQRSRRLFTSEDGVFEEVLALLDADGPVLLTSRETESSPPNLYRVAGGKRTALRPLSSPYPELDAVERRRINYQRGDGVELSGTLYLPGGWRKGDKPLPTLIWIYPYEYQDRAHAERLDVRWFRFHKVKGPSPLAAVLEGYAVLVNPTVPIVGDGTEVNDTYIEQLVASAEAAVDYLVDAGISDAARMAVGGRSYGAFSSANLMVHSRRFATAIAMSGAYNRTLTPFGFQRERRSFWEAADMYTEISPFFHANDIDAPILLVHGGADPNPGTPPLQARRFFHALVGEGVPVRYVELPYEGHHYWARESVLDATREMLDWLDHQLADPEAR